MHRYSPQILNQEDQNYHPLNYQELGSMNVSHSNEFSSLTTEDKRETKEMETKDDLKEQKEAHPEESSEGHQNSILVKGQWTHDEDKTALHNVMKCRGFPFVLHMHKPWVPFYLHFMKDLWTEEEEMILIEAHTQIGNKWATIARKLPGRTENTIKNHWNATKRRRFSKQKDKPNSILQEYIKSLSSNSVQDDATKSPLSGQICNSDESLKISFSAKMSP
ncbi:Transcription factor like [Actinidia chinensis var. chinensis]|uniref:Transcription factor like n=1 Tax=Actinidia chinensis var. chinensis TaxID=1590841 RepID=A0A2R6RK40_ACTCC|nr:Transcription factor like [Actinidia chinensis var. chinensis]